MPIATCFIKEKQITQDELRELAHAWASDIAVDVKDVCLTVVTAFQQAGQQYAAMANLYLPSLWLEADVRRIQKSLLIHLSGHFKIQPSDIFIMTSMIQSGHVVDHGEIIEW